MWRVQPPLGNRRHENEGLKGSANPLLSLFFPTRLHPSRPLQPIVEDEDEAKRKEELILKTKRTKEEHLALSPITGSLTPSKPLLTALASMWQVSSFLVSGTGEPAFSRGLAAGLRLRVVGWAGGDRAGHLAHCVGGLYGTHMCDAWLLPLDWAKLLPASLSVAPMASLLF